MDRVDSSLIALRQILRATELFGRDLQRTAGVSAAQFRAMQIVGESDRATATEIARRMRVSQATVTALVDKLERDELASRQKSTRDRRQIDITLTDKGRRTLAEVPDPLQQRFVRKFSAMADWEQAMLVASLERIAAMLEADDLDASPVLQSEAL